MNQFLHSMAFNWRQRFARMRTSSARRRREMASKACSRRQQKRRYIQWPLADEECVGFCRRNLCMLMHRNCLKRIYLRMLNANGGVYANESNTYVIGRAVFCGGGADTVETALQRRHDICISRYLRRAKFAGPKNQANYNA